MHISEGILSGPILAGSAVLAVAGTAYGLRGLDLEKIPRTAILAAAFFVASLIHLPVGPVSAHLILNGIVGLLLGWQAVPAILIALVLQGMLFQYGGITTLGVNTLIMAVPAIVCGHLFGPLIHRTPRVAQMAAFACGLLAVCLSGLLVALVLVSTEQGFLPVAGAVLLAHLPVMIIEGLVTMICINFIKKVQPQLLPGFRKEPCVDTGAHLLESIEPS